MQSRVYRRLLGHAESLNPQVSAFLASAYFTSLPFERQAALNRYIATIENGLDKMKYHYPTQDLINELWPDFAVAIKELQKLEAAVTKEKASVPVERVPVVGIEVTEGQLTNVSA